MKIKDLLEYTYGNDSAMAGQNPDFDRMVLRRDARRAGMSVDDYVHYLKKKKQDQEYEIEIGPEKRAELKAKADELAEMRRQQLRKEALENAELAFQRAETVAQREAEMEKIKRKFEHDLNVINTEHRNNMEAIKTGNKHDLDKMDKEHGHEKTMFDKEAGERDKDRQERERERQNNKPQNQGQGKPIVQPQEPEQEEEPEDKQYQDFKADIFKLSGLPLPAPQKPVVKPSKYDNSDAIDVDVKDITNRKDDKENNKPMGLPAPKKENMAQLRDLVAEMDKPKTKFQVGQMVKFGMWNKPEQHLTGKIVDMSTPYVLQVDVDGKTHEVHLANKSTSVYPAETPSKFNNTFDTPADDPTLGRLRSPRPAQKPEPGRVLRRPMALKRT
jgi:hypothetical protein